MEIKSYFTSHPEGTPNLDIFSGQIAGILLVIGYVCAVVMILYIGIRYTIANPAEKARLKTQLTYLAIGAILLVSGTTVLGVIGGAFDSVFDAPGWYSTGGGSGNNNVQHVIN